MDRTGSYSVRLQLLRKGLEKTWQEHMEAWDEFESIIRDFPSVIPEPDGSLPTDQALERANAAIDAHARIAKRYVDLLTERSMQFGAD